MRYKHFRKANVDVSAVTTGTWPLGCFGYGEANEKDGIERYRLFLFIRQ